MTEVNTNSAEAIREIERLAKDSQTASRKVHVLELPDRDAYLVVGADGEYTERSKDLPSRSHVVESVSEVSSYVTNFGDNSDEPNPVVWFSEDGVVAILDDDTYRRDRVVRPLEQSPAMVAIRSTDAMDQKALVRMLKTVWYDSLENVDELIRVISSLDFSSTSGGSSTVSGTRATIDRSIENEVRSQAGEIPERLIFNVRIFEDADLVVRRTIICALESEPGSPVFRVIPLAGQIRDALDSEMAHLRTILERDAKWPVFWGVPK